MDMTEAVKIAFCVQSLPVNLHQEMCGELNDSRLGYVWTADGNGTVSVKMHWSLSREKIRVLNELQKKSEETEEGDG